MALMFVILRPCDAQTGFRGGRPCADCPAEWRAERLDEGTCNEDVTLG